MAYETKVILKSVYAMIKHAKSVEEALEIVADIANVDGVVIDHVKETAQPKEEKE